MLLLLLVLLQKNSGQLCLLSTSGMFEKSDFQKHSSSPGASRPGQRHARLCLLGDFSDFSQAAKAANGSICSRDHKEVQFSTYESQRQQTEKVLEFELDFPLGLYAIVKALDSPNNRMRWWVSTCQSKGEETVCCKLISAVFVNEWQHGITTGKVYL